MAWVEKKGCFWSCGLFGMFFFFSPKRSSVCVLKNIHGSADMSWETPMLTAAIHHPAATVVAPSYPAGAPQPRAFLVETAGPAHRSFVLTGKPEGATL